MPGTRVAEGERVTLRPVEREDLTFTQRAATNPAIRYPLGSVVRSREELDAAFEDGDDIDLLVCLDGPEPGASPDAVAGDAAGDAALEPGETRPIGAVSVEAVNWKRPELSYWLIPEVHGEGYGREAVALAVEFVFRSRAVPAVAAGVYAHNDASRGLLESLGFREEGRLRRHSFTDGEWRDIVKYGLLREEWADERGE